MKFSVVLVGSVNDSQPLLLIDPHGDPSTLKCVPSIGQKFFAVFVSGSQYFFNRLICHGSFRMKEINREENDRTDQNSVD